MVQFFHRPNMDCNIKGIEAAHSSYQQLTIEQNRMQSTINTIQLAKSLKESATNGVDGSVIKVIITNLVYPICIDALYQIFTKYGGNVLKIMITQKSKNFFFFKDQKSIFILI